METVDLERYPIYKDSKVDWLGNVPEHWELKKIKRVFHEVKKRTNPDLNCGSISFGKVIYKDDEKIPESTKKSYQVVLNGDFLVNPLNLNYDLISLRIALSEIDVVVSSGYIVLSNSVKIDKNFYRWFLHRFDVAYMKLLGSGVRQTLNYNDIGNCDLLVPPIQEQTAIANFLNTKTAQIDLTIAQKEKQIELLKERRQVIFNYTVTHGLNGNVLLKDSGVESIAMMPEHWKLKKLKYLGKIKYGLGQPPKELEGGLPIIRATNVERGKIVEKGLIYVDPNDIPWERDPELKENDIIIVRSGAYTADSAIVTSEYAGAIAGYDMIFTPLQIMPFFISYVLLSQYVLYDQLYLLRLRAAQPHLNAEELGNTLILCPPINEQQEIAAYLGSFSEKVDNAIFCKRKEIETLKEYKATLINSAVTGKIKVS